MFYKGTLKFYLYTSLGHWTGSRVLIINYEQGFEIKLQNKVPH